MKNRGRLLYAVITLACLLVLSGCFYRDPVRHLASDICLVTPNLSQEEVLAMLGPPVLRRVTPEEGETWIYYEAKKSTLRKTPYLGDRMGYENYQVATITFFAGQVRTCVYRALTEEEFQKLGIPASESLGD